jgi:hypothetical protein
MKWLKRLWNNTLVFFHFWTRETLKEDVRLVTDTFVLDQYVVIATKDYVEYEMPVKRMALFDRLDLEFRIRQRSFYEDWEEIHFRLKWVDFKVIADAIRARRKKLHAVKGSR